MKFYNVPMEWVFILGCGFLLIGFVLMVMSAASIMEDSEYERDKLKREIEILESN